MDASHPTCDIHFNSTLSGSGIYIPPKSSLMDSKGLYSPLPFCFTADSREGYHMTYYWFYLLETYLL